ncbi:MAG: hypothetical protein Kow0077_00310 [Anaerolineae bacterium]
MHIRNIRWPQDARALAEHITRVHDAETSELLMQWYGRYPGFDPQDCFVIEGEDGEIAAHTMIIPRSLRIGAAVIPTGEIGVVGTLERFRQRGYARALMDHALERMTARGDALSLVLGIPNFYEQWDYEYAAGLYLTSYESEIETALALQAGEWSATHSYQRRTRDYLGIRGRQDTLVRHFDLGDLEAVMALYDRESAAGHYMVARDIEEWEWQLNFNADLGRFAYDDFLVAEREGRVLGYVRICTAQPMNWFRGESAARFSVIESAGEDPDATEALLRAVGQRAVELDIDRIGLFVHPDSRLMRHALAHGAVRRHFTGAAFLRLHDLERLAELLHPALALRLAESRYVARPFRLELVTDTQSAALDFNGGGDVVRVEGRDVDLVRLISGWFGVDDLPTDYYSEAQADLLRVLFPKRDPRLGMADFL